MATDSPGLASRVQSGVGESEAGVVHCSWAAVRGPKRIRPRDSHGVSCTHSAVLQDPRPALSSHRLLRPRRPDGLFVLHDGYLGVAELRLQRLRPGQGVSPSCPRAWCPSTDERGAGADSPPVLGQRLGRRGESLTHTASIGSACHRCLADITKATLRRARRDYGSPACPSRAGAWVDRGAREVRPARLSVRGDTPRQPPVWSSLARRAHRSCPPPSPAFLLPASLPWDPEGTCRSTSS